MMQFNFFPADYADARGFLKNISAIISAICGKKSFMDDKEVRSKIRRKEISFAGNRKLKIYGLLSCRSGKRMNTINRVFFVNEQEAITMGYRPCAHCMPDSYREWKTKQ